MRRSQRWSHGGLWQRAGIGRFRRQNGGLDCGLVRAYGGGDRLGTLLRVGNAEIAFGDVFLIGILHHVTGTHTTRSAHGTWEQLGSIDSLPGPLRATRSQVLTLLDLLDLKVEALPHIPCSSRRFAAVHRTRSRDRSFSRKRVAVLLPQIPHFCLSHRGWDPVDAELDAGSEALCLKCILSPEFTSSLGD